MKVLHTESSLGWGGQEIRTINDAHFLAEQNHSVLIATPSTGQLAERLKKENRPLLADCPIEKKSILGVLSLIKLLKTYEPDIVCTHSSSDSWTFFIARVFVSKQAKWIRYRHISAAPRQNWLSRRLYRAPDLTVTTSPLISEQLIQLTGVHHKKIISIPTGVVLPEPNAGKSKKSGDLLNAYGLSNRVIIVMVATLRSWKGHSYVIEAMRQLPLEACLLIVGDGPQRSNLETQVTRLNLREQVLFTGHLENPRPAFEIAQIFCQPSYANEGISQSVLQAAAYKLPIVTTAVGGQDRIVEDQKSGLLVEPHSTDGLVKALKFLIDHPVERARYGLKAFEKVSAEYTREKLNQKLLEEINRLLST